jgi:F-type H+-transporting ATPase subunit delta
MKYAQIAKRYANALFQLGEETKSQDKYYEEIKRAAAIFNDATGTNETLETFIYSPLVKAADKESAVKKALTDGGFSTEVSSLILLLAKKDRLPILTDIVTAYEQKNDERNGITRGTVRSGKELSASERQEIEKSVGAAVGKKVLLNFIEDKSVIAGVVTQVGSLTLDDSLFSHLRRMKESLNRSLH